MIVITIMISTSVNPLLLRAFNLVSPVICLDKCRPLDPGETSLMPIIGNLPRKPTNLTGNLKGFEAELNLDQPTLKLAGPEESSL